MQISTVQFHLLDFTGTDGDGIMLRRAILRETRCLKHDDPIRDKIAEFIIDIEIMSLSVQMGGEIEAVRIFLLNKWTEIQANIEYLPSPVQNH